MKRLYSNFDTYEEAVRAMKELHKQGRLDYYNIEK